MPRMIPPAMPWRTALAALMLAVFPAFCPVQTALAQGVPQAQPAPQPGTAPASVFVVSGVAVDASADSSAAARPVALAQGQRRAFTQLLQRLTLIEDRGRLPQPTEALLNDTIAGFEIDEERTSATRYLGRITVRFRPEAVRQLLQNQRLGYAEVQSRPILVLPVWQTAEGAKLWEADNPWRDAWKRRAEPDGLVPFMIAEASTAPEALPIDRLLVDSAQLSLLARQRNAGETLVVAASPVSPEGAGARVEIFPYFDADEASDHRLEPFVAQGATMEEALASAATELARRVENRWKRATRLDLDKPGQISVAAGFKSLADWVKLRDKLAEVPSIRRLEVLRLTHRDAQVQLGFFGEPQQLSVALAQKDVELRQRDGFWELGLRGTLKP